MSYRVSGHESFPFRYPWLPKAVRFLAKDSRFFTDEDNAMVELGVGKNMVRAIRFWSLAAGMASSLAKNGGHEVTPLGRSLLGPDGEDQYLEDIRTLWLIHWLLSTNHDAPLLAWDFLLNRWHEPDLVPSACLKALQREAGKQDDALSLVTLEQHFNTFLHTYVPTRGRKGEVLEDNLDCPLVELELIRRVGERELDRSSGKHEIIYAFDREEKPAITPGLFAYCLSLFWEQRHQTEATLPLSEVAHGHSSPGRVFQLPEEDIRTRLESLERTTEGLFTYTESTQVPLVKRNARPDPTRLLEQVYSGGTQ
ncbi:MAG: DUF4007 family protein [Acidobacteriota bacterium]